MHHYGYTECLTWCAKTFFLALPPTASVLQRIALCCVQGVMYLKIHVDYVSSVVKNNSNTRHIHVVWAATN